MRIHAVMLLGLGMMVGAGCSAPDPGVGSFGPPRQSSGTSGGTSTGSGTEPGNGVAGNGTTGGAPGTDAGSGDAGSGTGTGTGGGADAGGGGGTKDAGVDAGPPNAFTGAPAFASKPVDPAASAKTAHTNNGVGVVPDKNAACLDCHKAQGAGIPFLAAGTVFTDTAGTTPAADYEIRVVDSKGAAFSAHTDQDGNFRIDPPIAGTTGPYMTGGRNATKVTLMVAHPTDNNCNSSNCHGGVQGPIHIP